MKKILFTAALIITAANADKQIELKIGGMMCPACVKTVKGSINEVAGVKDSSVYLKDAKAVVKTDDKTTPAQLCDSIKRAGYECSVSR